MRAFLWSLVLFVLLGIAACSAPNKTLELVGTDITGADFAQSFSLTDHTGNQRQLSDFKGKAVALFFGYTHCPDVCPTTMADMANALKLLGSQADEVQVLFVTLDPERDTQQVMAQYVPSFDSRFIGLYGTPEQTAETAKNFKIFYAKQQDAGKSAYTIDHSAGTYVFDKNGNIRIYLKYGQKPAEIAGDIKQLL
jgi:protein SCO1/2